MDTSQFTVRTMEQWRSRKAVMASRGEVDGPRVEECTRALAFYRARAFVDKLLADGAIAATEADKFVDAISLAISTDKPAAAVSQ